MALSSDGTTALIGADGVNSDTGAAYVFHASAEGSWASSSTPTATLTNGSGSSDDSLRLRRGALLGRDDRADRRLPRATAMPGAAYVFHASAESSWASSSTPTATLTNGSGLPDDSSAPRWRSPHDGTTALIGADGVNGSRGAAYVFHASAEGSWASSATPTATLTNGSGSSDDSFGWAVAISSDGTTALIGAYGVHSYAGAAYVFHASAEGAWASSSTPTATLTNGSGATGDPFGHSVAISSDGTTALISATGCEQLRGRGVRIPRIRGGRVGVELQPDRDAHQRGSPSVPTSSALRWRSPRTGRPR